MALPAQYTTPKPVPPQADLEGLYLGQLWSITQVAKHYKVSAGTVHRWMHDLGIQTRPQGTNARMKFIGGRWLRQCQGVLHPEGIWLEVDKFHHFKKHGRITVRMTCKQCDDKVGKFNPFVPFNTKHKAWLESIVNRIGIMETCRRLDIHDKTLRTWRGRTPPKRIRRQHMLALVTQMRTLRVTGEVRHRDSIIRGAYLRGDKEKVPTRRQQFYRPHGDQDTEVRRRYRKLHGR